MFSVLSVVLVLAAGCGGSAGPGDDGSRALFVPFDQVRSSDAYNDVTDLAGGMVAWEAAGRAVEIVPEHGREAVATG